MRSSESVKDAVIAWLLDGDPSIRWQVMRDLLDAPQKSWLRERAKIATTGWGARLLHLQDPSGTWAAGIYTPKWTSTTYTLLLLRDLGLPSPNPAATKACTLILNRGLASAAESNLQHIDSKASMCHWRLARQCDSPTKTLKTRMCTCVLGMWLALPACFRVDDPRLELLVNHLVSEQMPDGGWNCQRHIGAVHSSFNTTLNVLDGIREAILHRIGPLQRLRHAESRAIEFMLMHRMYKSDKTGQVIQPGFTKFSFPPRWHYDVLRGLDYLRTTPAIADSRLQDAFDLLLTRRRKDGRWPAQNKHPGKTFFELEPPRQPSRWNTLRALRCLKARDAATGHGA